MIGMTDRYVHYCTAIEERQGSIHGHCKRMDEEVSRRLKLSMYANETSGMPELWLYCII